MTILIHHQVEDERKSWGWRPGSKHGQPQEGWAWGGPSTLPFKSPLITLKTPRYPQNQQQFYYQQSRSKTQHEETQVLAEQVHRLGPPLGDPYTISLEG